MHHKYITLCVLIIQAFIPVYAHADIPDDMQVLQSFGDFHILVMTFNRLGLVMSDTRYETLFFISIVISTLAWGGGFISRIFGRGSGNHLHGLVMILMGILVYTTFLRPKSDLIIHDSRPSDRMYVASGIPDGVCLLSSTYSKIVETVANMIWTSGNVNTPIEYSYMGNANGDIFNILQFVFQNTSFVPSNRDSSGQSLNQSIQSYFSDCVLFEITRLDGQISIADFFSQEQNAGNLLELFEDAQSDTHFTTWFDGNNGSTAVTCTQAYDNLLDEFAGIIVNSQGVQGSNHKFWSERCVKAGYTDLGGIFNESSSMENCREKALNFLLHMNLYDTDNTGINLLQQLMISSEISNYLTSNDIESLGDYRMKTHLKGEGVMASKWIPILQGVTFATYMGLMPFMFLLLPTPIFPKIFQFICGFFVFMCCWKVSDALLHSYAMDMAFESFREIMNNGLTLKSVWMMEGKSHTALLMFGKMRWASMGLAIALTSLIVKVGGHAFGALAGTMSSIRQTGSQTGSEVMDPVKRTHQLKTLPEAMPTQAITNEKGFGALVNRSLTDQRTAFTTHQNMMSAFGGDSKAAATAMADSASQQKYDNMAMTAKRQYLQDIATHGQATDASMSMIKTLASTPQGLKALNGTGDVKMNMSDTGRSNFENYLKANGMNIGKDNQLGKNVSFGAAYGSDGNVKPLSVHSNEGIENKTGDNTTRTISEDKPFILHQKSSTWTSPDGRETIIQTPPDIELIGGTITGNPNGTKSITNGYTRNGEFVNYVVDKDNVIISEAHRRTFSAGNFSNDLISGKLPEKNYDIANNHGAVVEAAASVLSSYISDRESVSTSYYSDVGISANTPRFPPLKWLGFDAGGRVGARGSETSSTEINMFSRELLEGLTNMQGQDNYSQALFIQNKFNEYKSRELPLTDTGKTGDFGNHYIPEIHSDIEKKSSPKIEIIPDSGDKIEK